MRDVAWFGRGSRGKKDDPTGRKRLVQGKLNTPAESS